MRLILICAIFLNAFSVFAAEPSSCTDKELTLAKHYLDTETKRFKAGATNDFSVWTAQDIYLNFQLCAGKITQKEYCAQKQKAYDDVWDSAVKGYDSSANHALNELLNSVGHFRSICH